jgi:hypothetical protein
MKRLKARLMPPVPPTIATLIPLRSRRAASTRCHTKFLFRFMAIRELLRGWSLARATPEHAGEDERHERDQRGNDLPYRVADGAVRDRDFMSVGILVYHGAAPKIAENLVVYVLVHRHERPNTKLTVINNTQWTERRVSFRPDDESAMHPSNLKRPLPKNPACVGV